VRYVHEHGLTTKREIRVGTASGVIVPRLEADGQVTVDMGVPRFEPADIPFVAPQRALTYHLEVGDRTIEVSAISMGNPHAVQIVPDVRSAPVHVEGPSIEAHPRFPRRANAGFMEIVDRSHIRLRVYERGAGETLACGTGACAAVVAGVMRDVLDPAGVKVETRGGELAVAWAGEGEPVMMTGPAVTVFEGEMNV
jgi:diaminopimelate epimerase